MTNKVKILKHREDFETPRPETSGAVGYDLRANGTHIVQSGNMKLIPLGVSVEVPKGYALQLLPRSSLFGKTGLVVGNSIGLIDQDYRGEIMLCLWNPQEYDVEILNGERIAQMVFVKIDMPELVATDVLSPSSRDKGGFGSTNDKGL